MVEAWQEQAQMSVLARHLVPGKPVGPPVLCRDVPTRAVECPHAPWSRSQHDVRTDRGGFPRLGSRGPGAIDLTRYRTLQDQLHTYLKLVRVFAEMTSAGFLVGFWPQRPARSRAGVWRYRRDKTYRSGYSELAKTCGKSVLRRVSTARHRIVKVRKLG